MSNERKLLKDFLATGNLLTCYGSKYMLSINDASSIDKVRFTMLPIGSGGKNPIDYYMDLTDCYTMLISEIDNFIAFQKIAADNGTYPSAYKFTTGENGSKHLDIGGGNTGVRVHMSDKEANLRYQMAISQDALKTLCFMFKLCYGLMPVTEGTYYGELLEAFKHRKKFKPDAETAHAPTEQSQYGTQAEPQPQYQYNGQPQYGEQFQQAVPQYQYDSAYYGG